MYYRRDAHLAVAKEEALWHSACGLHPDNKPGALIEYEYIPEDGPPASVYFEQQQDNAVFLIDKNCSPHGDPLYEPGFVKLLVGLRLNGSVKTLRTQNYPDSISNWP
jgi:hypothetical protein